MSDLLDAYMELYNQVQGLNWRGIFILPEIRHGKPANYSWWSHRFDDKGKLEFLEKAMTYDELVRRTYANHVGPYYVYQVIQLSLPDYAKEWKSDDYNIWTTHHWGHPYKTEDKAIAELLRLPFPGRIQRYLWNPEEGKVGLTAGVSSERWKTPDDDLIPFYWPGRLVALGAMSPDEEFLGFQTQGKAIIRTADGIEEIRDYEDPTYKNRGELNP